METGKSFGAWLAAHKIVVIIGAVALAAGITTGVLFGTGVFNSTPSTEDTTTEEATRAAEHDEAWLREQLAAEGELTIELDDEIKVTEGFEVHGTKILKGTGKISITESSSYALSVEDGAVLTVDGVSLNLKNVASNAVIVRDGGSVTWNDGTISYPKQYSFMAYGDVTINGGTIEYAGVSWVYCKSGRTVNVNGGNFIKSGSVGFEVEKGATLNITGDDTWIERAGTNTINNNGTVVMTGGTISQSEVWTITNHASLTMKDCRVQNCSLKGVIYNYAEATKCYVENCVFDTCKTYHVYNCATVDLVNTILENSNASTINNNKGTVNLTDCQILNSNYHSIYNLQGEININNLVCDGTVYKAVQNKYGYVTIDGLTCRNIGGTAIGNVAVTTGGDYGWIKGKNIEIEDAGEYGVVSYGGQVEFEDLTIDSATGTPVYVRNGEGTFTNLIVKGSLTEGKACVCGGSTTWRTSVLTISGDKTYLTGGSRGISNYGTLTLNGGTITGNHSSGEQEVGAGVYNVGKFIMNGGTITGNESSSYGGGVRNGTSKDADGTTHYGVMYMYGGEVTDNYSASNGGGISIGAEGCELHMYGGTVSGNRANGKGDGFMVAGLFELYDGVITDNDVYLYENTNKVTVKGTSLNKDNKITITTTNWNGASANNAIEFDDAASLNSLSSVFTCGNDQWSFIYDDKYISAVKADNDISYTDLFKDASAVDAADFATLKQEIESAERGSAKVIRITSSFMLEDSITLPYDVSIKLIDDGSTRTLKRSTEYKDVLFNVGKDSTLVLAGKSELSINGNAGSVTAAAPLVKTTYGGTFVLTAGGKLTNAFSAIYDSSLRAAAINVYGGQFIMTGGTIDNCGSAAADGNGTMQNLAAIYSATSGVISIQGGTLKNCQYGVIRSYGRVYMSDGLICDNSRIGDGGTGIRACNMVMTGGTISNNLSSNSGCGIYITQSEAYPTAYFRMDGGLITGNTSSRDTDKGASAGAVYISSSAIAYFNAGTISNNIAGKGTGSDAIVKDAVTGLDQLMGKHGGQSGAGIYNEGTAYVNAGMVISGNIAYNSGGGIYSNGRLYIDGAQITGNETIGVYSGYGGGGAIMLTGTSYTEIKNATISNNKSGSSGTIYIDSSAELKMTDTVMADNTATGKSFSGYNSGSAILNKNKLTIENCTFEDNVAGSKAAVYTDAGSNTTITDSRFTGNSGAGAGAIANTSAYMLIKNTLFEGNYCQGTDSYSNGGAIMNQRKDSSYPGGEMIIDGCEFRNNTAYQRSCAGGGGGYGGAVYNDYGVLTVRDSKFSGNIAECCGKDILNSSNSEGLTLAGTLEAEELYFNVSKGVTLSDDFAPKAAMDTIFNTYVDNSRVLVGSESVLKANAGKFTLKTTMAVTGEAGSKPVYDVIDETGYKIFDDGILNSPAAAIGDTEYWTLAEALAAVNPGEVIDIRREVYENLSVDTGETLNLQGGGLVKGDILVAGTLNITDVTLAGNVNVSGILGVSGSACVTDPLTLTGKINVNGRLTAATVATIVCDTSIGNEIITGEVDEATAARFAIANELNKQVGADGKIAVVTDTVKLVRTGEIYDTFAEAVAAAQDGDTIELLKSTAAGVTVDKNITVTSADKTLKLNGVVTVAAGKVLTIRDKAMLDTVALGGTGAKLGIDETAIGGCATIDASALGIYADLQSDGIVLLSGDIAGGYAKVSLKDDEGLFALTSAGTIGAYAEAKIGDTYYATFDEAYNAAEAGDTIVLVHDIALTKGYKVDKALTITTDGNERTITWPGRTSTTDNYAFNASALLKLEGTGEDGRLIIDGLGVTAKRPMLCFQYANCSMKYVTVQNSVSSDGGYGGALYTNKTGLVFDYVNFLNNSCTAASGNDGGAVRISASGEVTFNNCQFVGNYSATYGGALMVNASYGKATLNSCLFENNSSASVGGAIYNNQSSGNGSWVIANNCTFKNNSTTGNGGVIRSTGQFIFDGCTFEGNSGNGDISANTTKGYTRTVKNCVFVDKSVTTAYDDSAETIIHYEGNTYAPLVRSEIAAPVLKAASADFDDAGHAITDLIEGFDSEKMTIETTFGGEVVTEAKLPGVYTITVTAGEAYKFADEALTAVLTYTINAVKVEIATPALKAGMDNFYGDGTEKAIADLVDNYVAEKMTAVVTVAGENAILKDAANYVITITAGENYKFADSETVVTLNVVIRDATDDIASVGGVNYASLAAALAAANEGDTVTLLKDIETAVINKYVVLAGGKTITNATIKAAALKNGQAAAMLDLTGVTLTNVTMDEDVAVNSVVFKAETFAGKYTSLTNEGKVLITDEAGNAYYTVATYLVTIGDARYATLPEAVTAAKAGDTLVLHGSMELEKTLVISKSLTIKTASDLETDVVITTKYQDKDNYMINVKATITLAGSEKSRIVLDGKGVSYDRPVLCIQGSDTEKNESSLSYVTVQNSKTTYQGGGIYFTKCNAVLDNCIITNCVSTCSSSTGGGAMYLTGTAAATVKNSTISNNSSALYGGVAHIATSGAITLENCLVEGNTAANVGGALYAAQGSSKYGMITAKNTVFKNNTTKKNGGVIRATGGFALEGCTFIGNSGADADISEGNGTNYPRTIDSCVFDKTEAKAIAKNASTKIVLGEGEKANTFATEQ